MAVRAGDSQTRQKKEEILSGPFRKVCLTVSMFYLISLNFEYDGVLLDLGCGHPIGIPAEPDVRVTCESIL